MGAALATPAGPLRTRDRLRANRLPTLLNAFRLGTVELVQRENSSWLSLATRSNTSFAFLMRYW
jgi:hypothetical protein